MDYFTGEGRVVSTSPILSVRPMKQTSQTMIININPYDTGFDENSNVMKFAALAREVSTAAPTQRVPPTGRAKTPTTTGSLQTARTSGSHHRKVLLFTNGRDRKSSETQLDVVEGRGTDIYRISHYFDLGTTLEDEDIEDGPEEEPLDGLVEALFDEIEHLRLQVRFLYSIMMSYLR